jgi:hypothetical protein
MRYIGYYIMGLCTVVTYLTANVTIFVVGAGVMLLTQSIIGD